MNPSVSIAVYGASGRMGQAILRLAVGDPRTSVVAAIAAAAPAVLVDFSSAEAFDEALAIALARKIGLVSGTTGLSSAQRAAMENAAATIPVLWSANSPPMASH